MSFTLRPKTDHICDLITEISGSEVGLVYVLSQRVKGKVMPPWRHLSCATKSSLIPPFSVTGGASSGQWLYWGGCRTRAWKWPAEARVSWIAPERPGRSGRETAHSMRRNSGTSMAAVTWRLVPRSMCHVPSREPFEKCCFRAAAQTGSVREFKLSVQKRLGLNFVPLGESAPRGQNCAPRGNFFSLLPSSSDTLEPRDPKFGTRVHVSKVYPNQDYFTNTPKDQAKVLTGEIVSYFIFSPGQGHGQVGKGHQTQNFQMSRLAHVLWSILDEEIDSHGYFTIWLNLTEKMRKSI